MTKKKKPEDLVGAGRPTIMTPDRVNKLEQAFALGCSDKEACLYADISKQTLYSYQKKNPEFVDRKEILKESLVLKARTVIADSLNNKNEDTARWYLERKKKAEFSTRQEITGEDGESLTPVINILPIEVKNGNSSDTE